MTQLQRLSKSVGLSTVLLCGLFSVASLGSHAWGQEPQIEGTWRVVSVELAGQKLEGVAGAELTLRKGQKSFKLPSGDVEVGTYQIDATVDPRQIKSTTEGKEGVQSGIWKISGDTLRMCLATQSGARPKTFTTRQGTDQLLIVFERVDAKPESEAHPTFVAPTGTRSFRMGFTGFVYDLNLTAVNATRTFCQENGDLIAHHIEGVPWYEALNDRPLPKAILDEWEGKKLATPPQGQVYLAVSPGRGEMKLADKGGPLPKALVGKSYDDPLVMRAYLNYCRRAVEFFKPDYLAIGIEVNEIHDGGPRAWEAYATLHQHVYEALKQDHPDLPIFASWTLHNMFKRRGAMLASFQELMPHNDIIAVSYYPFFLDDSDRLLALDWMVEQFDQFKKPFAMAETNDAAERLPLPEAKVVIEGTPEKQAAYYQRLLTIAQEQKFLFVVSFVHQDYDALWDKIKATAPELFMIWRDCGLLDQAGQPRPAYNVWKGYFSLPLADSTKR